MGSSFSPNPEFWKLRTLYSPCDSMKTQSVVSSLSLKHVTERNNKNNNNNKNKNMVCRLVNGFTFCSPKYKGMQRVKHICSANFDDFHSKEILEPSLLGIKPEAPSWPEREEILRLSFERKVKSVGIPLSIRMIKKKLKLQLEEGFKDSATSSELMTQCSIKKTFSSMLFILHELQNHALQTKEAICCEDLKSVMAKLQREMDDSFVWLFQQVFWETPNLMVDIMVFLANFSVFSMSNNVSDVDVDQGECVKELSEEEEMLWNSMLEEVSKMEKELWSEDLDHETVRMFVAPLSVELEGDQYEEYEKTELYYKKHLRLTPYNSLILSNYAQFLFLVRKDNDRAEEYYRHSVMVESPEAEAFSRYADFLWKVRNDTWAAELRYLQAIEIEPNNSHYSSKYASFLWNTGGQDSQDSTSGFPIEELDNLQI